MKTKDPLAPIEFIVTCLGALAAFFLIAVPLTTTFGSGTFLAFGKDADACITLQPAVGAEYSGADGGLGFVDARPHIRQQESAIDVCDPDPSLEERLLASTRDGAVVLFSLGFLLLTYRLVRRARRMGIFRPEVARSVAALGWYLLLGTVARCVVETVAGAVLSRQFISGYDGIPFAGWSWPAVIAGFATLTVGRMLDHTVAMQDELDATV